MTLLDRLRRRKVVEELLGYYELDLLEMEKKLARAVERLERKRKVWIYQ